MLIILLKKIPKLLKIIISLKMEIKMKRKKLEMKIINVQMKKQIYQTPDIDDDKKKKDQKENEKIEENVTEKNGGKKEENENLNKVDIIQNYDKESKDGDKEKNIIFTSK